MSAARVSTLVVAPARFVRLGVVIIGVVTTPSNIAVSLVASTAVVIAVSRISSIAVIAVSPKAFVAVLARRLVATSSFFLGGVFCTLRVESLSAGCASSALPIRLSLFCREAPQVVFCPARASRIGEYGRAIVCGPSCSTIKWWEVNGLTFRVRGHCTDPRFHVWNQTSRKDMGFSTGDLPDLLEFQHLAIQR